MFRFRPLVISKRVALFSAMWNRGGSGKDCWTPDQCWRQQRVEHEVASANGKTLTFPNHSVPEVDRKRFTKRRTFQKGKSRRVTELPPPVDDRAFSPETAQSRPAPLQAKTSTTSFQYRKLNMFIFTVGILPVHFCYLSLETAPLVCRLRTRLRSHRRHYSRPAPAPNLQVGAEQWQ